MSEKTFNLLSAIVGAISTAASAIATYTGSSKSTAAVGIIGVISTALVQIFSKIEGDTAKAAESSESGDSAA